MNTIKLYHKDGTVESFKWGSIPDAFFAPALFKDIAKAMDSSESTVCVPNKKEFHLCGIEDRRFLCYNRQIGHYVEV